MSVPWFLVPRFTWIRNQLFSSRSFLSRIYLSCQVSRTLFDCTPAPPRKLLWVFGLLGCSLGEGGLLLLVRVVSAVYDCAPSLYPALRSLHGRPGCSGSIDLPTSCPSLSPIADDEAYAYHHGDASSTSPSTPLRPKSKSQ